MSDTIISSLQLFFNKGLPFVLFRLPNEKDVNFVAQRTRKLEKRGLHEIDSFIGFLVAEFSQTKSGTAYFIRPDIVMQNGVLSVMLLNELEQMPNVSETFTSTDTTQSHVEYLESAKKLINKLKSGELQKVVLSRVIHAETDMIDKGKLFTTLEQKYPDAFVYLMHLPHMGIWTGATPETLLRINIGFAETVALAGTNPIDKINWTYKEKEEQEMVTAYIEEALKEEHINSFEKSGSATIKAGNLAHLKTTFKIPVAQLKGKTGKLISRLHPTPAVCGLPKEKAYNLIQEIEEYDRELYTGFLGPWNLNEKSHLFVNLRCAKLYASSVTLFVGGGITASSNAEDEWEETVSKSKTLLSVLKNL